MVRSRAAGVLAPQREWLSPVHTTALKIWRLMRAKANRAQAEAIVRTMSTRDPSVAMWCCCAGLTLDRAGKLTQAEQALREAIEIGPKNFDYSDALAILYLGSGRLEKSLAQARRIETLAFVLAVKK